MLEIKLCQLKKEKPSEHQTTVKWETMMSIIVGIINELKIIVNSYAFDVWKRFSWLSTGNIFLSSLLCYYIYLSQYCQEYYII